MSAAVSFLARYDALDVALQACGFPATSPWWRTQLARFFERRRRRWIIRAGRRAGKSSTLCRLAVAWALWGEWSVPAGDIAVIPFVSVDRDEASARLRTIASILRAVGVQFQERSDEIELGGSRPVLFRVVTCSVRGTVGFTSIADFCDEVALWESRETGANPAAEVVGNLAPTMATQPAAFMVLSSSPWGGDDFHAQLFDQGDTEHQMVSFAATWTANPTLTEQDTHDLEPDPKAWSRAYASIPQAGLTTAFDHAHVDRCFWAPNRQQYQWGRPVMILDPGETRNTFAWSIGSWGQPLQRKVGAETTFTDEHGNVFRTGAVDRWNRPILLEAPTKPVFYIFEIGGFAGPDVARMGMGNVVAATAAAAKQNGVEVVLSDQRGDAYLASMYSPHRLRFRSFRGTNAEIHESVCYLRTLMRDGPQLAIVDHEQMKRDLKGFPCRVTAGGFKYGGRSGSDHHFDHASTLVTFGLAMLEERGVPADQTSFQVEGAPTRQPTGYRTMVSGAATFPAMPSYLPGKGTST